MPRIPALAIIHSNLNWGYNPRVSFKENVDPRLRYYSANKQANELRKLIEIDCQDLLHIQELQNRTQDKGIKSRSYALGKKVWLNSKYIRTKQQKKLKKKFFEPF